MTDTSNNDDNIGDVEWSQSYEEWRAWLADKPMLARLYDARVFTIGTTIDGYLGIVEGCDNYFFAKLTHEDVGAMIAELGVVMAEMRTTQGAGV